MFGARLRITGLSAGRGPGIELLEYLAPSNGRPMPVDTRANDLWHWQIRVISARLPDVATAVRKSQASFVSPGVVETGDETLGYGNSIMLRDPDGHALLVTER